MRVVRFGELRNGDWFIHGVTPYRSSRLVVPNEPIPCIDLLALRVAYFCLDDDVLVMDQEDVVKLDGHIRLDTSVSANKELQRPHGEWIYKKFDEETGISNSYFCSCCNFPLTGIYDSYCAVCGADMRKEG